MARYATLDGELLCRVVQQAAAFHDLGKLDEENQQVLSGAKAATALPKNHVDAGVAQIQRYKDNCQLAMAVVQAHHRGLADFVLEANRGKMAFRDGAIMAEVDKGLAGLEAIHNAIAPSVPLHNTGMAQGDMAVFLRLALSCLADADHEDTAQHYGKTQKEPPTTPLNAKERLRRLDAYVQGLQSDGKHSKRDALRTKMYNSCRDCATAAGIASCDSPVGSGKTTAIMAHLLAQAEARGLRRIIVVLPFTNIITQSVQVYRKALVLPGENPEDVVAELHHRADFESEETRHFTALWRAPIIVTTAVAFFETLASNSTSTLRRLHQLPGSAIFVDEAHAALPVQLLPLAWQWMKAYASQWGCYWLLASGSLNRFWQIKEIKGESRDDVAVPEIVGEELRRELSLFEAGRIAYKADLKPKSIDGLVGWVSSSPGPRLLILNTVQNAAVIADCFRQKFGRNCVEHLSSALTPADREATLERVKARLSNQNADPDWTLVATSCVEAGVDLSFQNGFRELASTVSLLQAAGRINREGEAAHAEIHSFCLEKCSLLNTNPSLKGSAEILKQFFESHTEITPALSTQSIAKEITLQGSSARYKTLVDSEAQRRFPKVKEDFAVIESCKQIAIVNQETADRLLSGAADWKELQRNSVQIPQSKLANAPMLWKGIYHWRLGYDDFLGYMAGVIAQHQAKQQ